MTQIDNRPFHDVESWAKHYVLSSELRDKIAPPPVPERFSDTHVPQRIQAPGRPATFFAAPRKERTPKPEALIESRFRARVLHTFFHHELQAAELMCWALVAFSDAELEFRKGLLRICLDEIRHMNLYREHIEKLGFSIGAFGIRDWFWKRVPSCPDKISFVAVMGMGLEAANLEYAPIFASRFRAVGDETGAEIQERIAKEELSHVAFGTKWFKQWTGGCDFQLWSKNLPLPLSPAVLHGTPIDNQLRLRAGMTEQFLADLSAYIPDAKGRPMPEEQNS
jgi:uncharacterized ferritin-like protein (DUF455 family)